MRENVRGVGVGSHSHTQVVIVALHGLFVYIFKDLFLIRWSKDTLWMTER